MAATKTALCQLALARLGSTTNISDVDADTSQEAKLCRIFYDNALLNVFEECDWPFAKATIEIALLETNLTGDWKSHYAYPNDAARVHSIFQVTDVSSTYPQTYNREFEIVYGATGKRIATYYDVALKCNYTKVITNVQLYPSSFNEAFIYRLAADLALGLNKSMQISGSMNNAYLDRIKMAKANQRNENNFTSVANVIVDRIL